MRGVGVGVCEWFLRGSQVCVEKLWAGLVFDAGKVDLVTSVAASSGQRSGGHDDGCGRRFTLPPDAMKGRGLRSS